MYCKVTTLYYCGATAACMYKARTLRVGGRFGGEIDERDCTGQKLTPRLARHCTRGTSYTTPAMPYTVVHKATENTTGYRVQYMNMIKVASQSTECNMTYPLLFYYVVQASSDFKLPFRCSRQLSEDYACTSNTFKRRH